MFLNQQLHKDNLKRKLANSIELFGGFLVVLYLKYGNDIVLNIFDKNCLDQPIALPMISFASKNIVLVIKISSMATLLVSTTG